MKPDELVTISDDDLSTATGGATVFGQMFRTLGQHYVASGRQVGTTLGRQYRDAGRAVVNAYRW